MPSGGRVIRLPPAGFEFVAFLPFAFWDFFDGLGPMGEVLPLEVDDDDDSPLESEAPDARRSKLDFVRVCRKWNWSV